MGWYSLNMAIICQNSSFFHLDNSVSIYSEHHVLYCNAWWGSHEKITLTFLFLKTFLFLWLSFTNVTRDEIRSCFSVKYKLYSLFVVSRLSTKIQLSIQGLLIVIEMQIRKTISSKVKHIWTSIVWQWTNRKHFLFAQGNIWKFKVGFCNKTTC